MELVDSLVVAPQCILYYWRKVVLSLNYQTLSHDHYGQSADKLCTRKIGKELHEFPEVFNLDVNMIDTLDFHPCTSPFGISA